MSAVEPPTYARIAELARTVHGAPEAEFGPDQVLRRMTESAVEILPGVDYAGVTLVTRSDRNGRPELASTAETGPIARQFDDLQHEYGDGPCFEAIWQERTVGIADVETEVRWPELMHAVRERTPIRSTLSIQLYVGDRELGALNLFAASPNAFDQKNRDLARVLATHAAIALSSARRGQQFRSALASRDIIGQAKGMIMERYRVDAVRAFEIIRQLSQESNIPVAEVAVQIVAAEEVGDREPTS
ncbi:GAF and ANTAR domain-containing protein [Gordonia sp. DT30]|uniref:GAF and ANTAR domain-containing protein n=1 Tax=unclassified Gordonia (in: high G+C Gram-positive bacteria) TaxID=2657482 RepID=UPI003CF2DDC2